MARPLRIQFENATYHVMARGNARQAVFLSDDDFQEFLMSLRDIANRLDWSVSAYCLMPNHYHLLVRTLRPTLARGMRDLNGSHSQRFNKRHGRIGHLFQGRYKALVVEESSYLLELARYIVLNPVRARLCVGPEQWPWSSYGVTAGLSASCVDPTDTLIGRSFGRHLEGSRAAYVAFVAAGIGAPKPVSALAEESVVGTRAFAKGLERYVLHVSSEVPRRERGFKTVADYAAETPNRNEAIRRAHASGLFSLAHIGNHFGLSYATISRVVSSARLRGGTPINRSMSSEKETPGDSMSQFKT